MTSEMKRPALFIQGMESMGLAPQALHHKMASTKRYALLLSLMLSLCLATSVRSKDDCVYTVYIRTGSILKAGTDSIVGIKLYDSYGYHIHIKDLERWGGLMGPGYNYFERGNLDIFSGRGPCLERPVCAVNVTSDGSGPHHGWYCNYVEVTTTGAHTACAQRSFTVEQWLALDAWPYRLWAVANSCSYNLEEARPKAAKHGIRSAFSILSSASEAVSQMSIG